ncbi:MAG: phosphoribosyltransferase [Spirochaetota bacterium]
MKKVFLSYDRVRNNSIKMAHRIYKDGFIPDVIYVSLRGGAYPGNVISEYFKIVRKNQRPVFYAAVVARSYTDVSKQENIMIDGWTYNPEYLRSGDKVLLVDDIFDSGRTINRIAEFISSKGLPRTDIKIAVHDYKIMTYKKEQLHVQPDYYCNKYVIDSPDEDIWIHYMSHELVGLNDGELEKYYFSADPELKEALEVLHRA